jgi:hypothetical protein
MRVAIFDRVEPSVPDAFPFRLFATCSQRNAAFKLVFAVPAMALLAIATVMLIVEAWRAPGARSLIALHPALAFEVVAALGFWAYLLGMPVKRLFERLTVTRILNIDRDCVAVTEHSRLATRTWSVPLTSYLGVAHHVRATLSGSRHELILVHPEREKSVLLSLAPAIDQGELERVAALLGMAIIPAGALYRFSLRWPAMPAWRAPAHA